MPKKILLITYHFPPSQAVGGLRIFNLAKHLPKHGWQTEVLTIRPGKIQNLSYHRLAEIPEIKIHRTNCLPTLMDLYIKLKSIYRSIIEMKYITPEDLQKTYVRDPLNINQKTKKVNIKHLLISIFLSMPDGERGWILPAVLKAYKLIRRNRYDFILTSCPPYSVHVIGLILKKITGIPWVADYRDPWLKGSNKKLYITTPLSNRIEVRLENEVLQKADLIMTTTKKLCDVFTQFYNTLNKNKRKTNCICQYNGFDEQIIDRIQAGQKYERFTISYTGSLYFGRTPEPIFNAVSRLIEEKELNKDQIRIKLVGHCDRIEDKTTQSIIEKYKLDGIVQISDPVPYEESIKIVKKSHLALLLAPDQPLQIPAKVFDYIGAGTTILTITQKGATFDLIEYTSAGKAFDPEDIMGIKKFIKESIKNNNVMKSTIPKEITQRFTSQSLAKNVAENLNMCLKDC